MYTEYNQQICPGGWLCLEGVYTNDEDDIDGYIISTPFDCPKGSYCLVGSDLVIGSGLCPIGYFCSDRTEFPVSAPAGFYTGNFGAVEAAKCTPGTFQLYSTGSKCNRCPAGYMCKLR